jgi:hypothetical protein
MTGPVYAPVDERADAWYLQERYRRDRDRRRVLRGFYRVKPLIPRPVQIALRRVGAQRQRRTPFPAWPYEDVLLRQRADALRAELASRGTDSMPIVGLWPQDSRFAWVLTHDVEGPLGLERMEWLQDIERRHGCMSSWNLCANWYPIADADLQRVRAAGGEIGVHGLYHDDRLFRDRSSFEASLPGIRHCMEAWGAEGFRAPALHRDARWMHELPCSYDSSYPHSDPFQPLPGGCCAIHPFFFGDVVELPLTLEQDFTLFELLRERTVSLWTEKSRWIIRHHGLINVLVHPDYMTAERLERYEELLVFLREQPGGWHALPREVARWWRQRSRLTLHDDPDGAPAITGDGAERARIALVRPDHDGVRYET